MLGATYHLFARMFSGRSSLEQHLAVFGESGSGKTTLVSAFYGWHQERAFRARAGYGFTAADSDQGVRLHQQYLQLPERFPAATRFRHHAFEFLITVDGIASPAGKLVWHDYPGEWWTEPKQGEEGQRQSAAFRSLLQSDSAFLLCDGQRFRADGPKYLKGLFRRFSDALKRQAAALASQNVTLSPFPHIWVICLSKADLLPDNDVHWFKNEVIRSAGDELIELREAIQTLTGRKSDQAIGEDFLLLSSAKVDPATGKVVDAKRPKGLDLIPPIAIVTPVRWAMRWTHAKGAGTTTAHRLIRSFKGLTTNWLKYLPIVGNLFWLLDDMLKATEDKLLTAARNAAARGNAAEAGIAAMMARLADRRSQDVYFSDSLPAGCFSGGEPVEHHAPAVSLSQTT